MRQNKRFVVRVVLNGIGRYAEVVDTATGTVRGSFYLMRDGLAMRPNAAKLARKLNAAESAKPQGEF